MFYVRLTRRIDALTQVIPSPIPIPDWDIRRLSDEELEALLPLAARLQREGPAVRWRPDEARRLERAWNTANEPRAGVPECHA